MNTGTGQKKAGFFVSKILFFASDESESERREHAGVRKKDLKCFSDVHHLLTKMRSVRDVQHVVGRRDPATWPVGKLWSCSWLSHCR